MCIRDSHRTVVPDRDAVDSVPDHQHFDAQFVSQHAGVGEEGLLAAEGVQVGATDSDPLHADQRLAWSGLTRRVGFAQYKLSGFFEGDRLVGHGRL